MTGPGTLVMLTTLHLARYSGVRAIFFDYSSLPQQPRTAQEPCASVSVRVARLISVHFRG